jgi:hypothetical protein
VKKALLYLLFSIAFTFAGIAQSGIQIHVVPALHNIHKVNTNYNYDSLKVILQRINPDVLIVEIRQEDLDRDTSFLRKNYPVEMWATRFWFPTKLIYGMDWFGKDIEGKPLPDNYWKEIAPIKKWEKALEADSSAKDAVKDCEIFLAERIPLLKEGTYEKITDGTDEKLALKYYQCLEKNLLGTTHSRITDYYKQRNISMADRILEIVASNGKGNYVILAGADHVPYIKMYLYRKGLGQFIK